MKRIKQYLDKYPRKKGSIELELLEAGVNFYHIISLMWEKTTRKHTREFLIWKAQEILETMINNLPNNVEIETFENRLYEEIAAIKDDCGDDPNMMFHLLGAEIDNSTSNEIAFTFDFKVAIMIYLLETIEHITLNDLMAKYC